MKPMELLVDGLACYRLTRLVTADKITRPLRERAIRVAYKRLLLPTAFTDCELRAAQAFDGWEAVVHDDDEDPPKLAQLVTCRWCTGVWVAVGVVVARRLFPRAWGGVAEALAFSAAAALVAGLEDD